MIDQNQTAARAIASAALLAESNHRIANNLAVVAGYLILQANRTVREGGPIAACEVHSILAAASAKVSAAGNLHHMLTTTAEGVVDLGEYLERVARSALDAMTVGKQFELELEFEPGCVVAADQALNLGLLVGELIINAIKHSHPAGSRGRIEAGCSLSRDGIAAWVRDDGVGLPEGFDLKHDGGIGMRTLRLIAQQVGVEVDFFSGEIGLTVQIRVPAAVPAIPQVQFA
jgi:two-component sensor histidine kinase